MRYAIEYQKPLQWDLEILRTPPEATHIWKDLTLAMPLWEGAHEFAEDVSGHGMHSTTWYSSLTWVKGALGIGLNCPGSAGGNFEIADPSQNYLDGCANLTVEFWYIPGSVTGTQGIIGKYRPEDYKRSWRIFSTGTELYMEASSDGLIGTYQQRYTSGAGLSVGTLYHVVMTFGAGDFHVYINGVEQTITGGDFTITSIYGGTYFLQMGRRTDGSYLNAQMYSIRIWQRVISAEERKFLFENPFRMYERDWPYPTLAEYHGAGATPAGPWTLVGQVPAGVEELYLQGLENGVSYDVYATTQDLTGNISTGCADESATPVAGSGVYAELRHGISVRPCVPIMPRRYR